MNEQQLQRMEARLHNPRNTNSAGERANVILTPSELSALIEANRELNHLREIVSVEIGQ